MTDFILNVVVGALAVAAWRGWWPLSLLPESWHPWIFGAGAFMLVVSAVDGVDDVFEAIGSGQPFWAVGEAICVWLGFLVVREIWQVDREVRGLHRMIRED